MDVQKCMIVDLERRDDKRKFITEQVASISENKNGLWMVRFLSSPRVFNYNHSRLLYLMYFEFGKRYKSSDRRINNSDNESGILNVDK